MFPLHHLISPKHFCKATQPLVIPGYMMSLIIIGLALYQGLFIAPIDAIQGEVYRIIYIHVPLAFLSMGIYLVMALMGGIYWIWHIKLANMIAHHCATLGWLITTLAIITGAIWGKPTWGTYWIWDARLTAEFILWLMYAGQYILRSVITQPQKASLFCAIFAVIGAIDLPIIHYSVNWWYTLHQGSSLLRLGKPTIDHSMLLPLALSIIGFALLCATIVLRGIIITNHLSKKEGRGTQQYA